MRYKNEVEFQVYGDYALFSEPITRMGGEKCSYQIPTYEALKGIISSIYWKPTIIWVIDSVRVMNQIQTEVKGMRPIKYKGSNNDLKGGNNDLSYYTYLKNCRYQVRAHFVWNMNRPELEADRDENKHHNIAKRMIEKGGRRDVFLGTRECQAYVEPCAFGEGKSFYDSTPRLDFGLTYHGITYADESMSENTAGQLTIRLWYPVMLSSVIDFCTPEECTINRTAREMKIQPFDSLKGNFTGLSEFAEDFGKEAE